MESSTQVPAVIEFTRSPADQESDKQSIVQQEASMESGLANQQRRNDNTVVTKEYATLLAHYMEQGEELRAATERNVQLDKKLEESETLVQELQNSSTLQRLKMQKDEEKLAELTKVEEESKSHHMTMLEAEDAIKRKEGVIKYLNKERDGLIAKSKASEKKTNQLQTNMTVQRLKLQENEEKLANLAKLEEESKSHHMAISEVEDVIKRNQGVIEELNKDRDDMIVKLKLSEKKVEKMEDELSGCQEMLEKSKSLAEEQRNVLLENENTIGGLEVKNAELQNEVEYMKDQLTEKTQTIESKDAMVNMLRQEMGEREAVLKLYETKFQGKDVNIPQIVARADEGERLWSKIEEREKKFAAKDIILSAVRDENAILQEEKKILQSEIDDLRLWLESYELKLSEKNEEVHMPRFLAQLRESAAQKEKIDELEEIIKCEGYTTKMKETERVYKEKEMVMALEMEKVGQIIETLRSQTTGVQNMEVPVLLGKLDECLHELGKGNKPFDNIISTAQSDISQGMPLNPNNAFTKEEEKSPDSMCICTGDFEDLMHLDHYKIMTNLTTGFGYLKTKGEKNDEEFGVIEIDYDGRDGTIDTYASANEDEKVDGIALG